MTVISGSKHEEVDKEKKGEKPLSYALMSRLKLQATRLGPTGNPLTNYGTHPTITSRG